MTASGAVAYIKRFTLHGGLRTWGAELSVYTYDEAVCLRVRVRVHDRDHDEELIPITFEDILDARMLAGLPDPEVFLDHWVRRAFKHVVDHELAESVKFDGKRVLEAHGPPSLLPGE